jgi:hypothetical protein
VHYTVVDTTAPALPTMSDANAVATAPTGAPVTYTVASAVDAVDGNVPVSCLPASGSTFPVGDTAVVCKATDASGNSATGGFTVHVTHPAPTIDGPGSAQASAVGASTPVTFAPAVTASDVVDGTLPVTCTDGAGNSVAPTGGSFELGDTTVTCAATNSAASSVSHVVHVSVVDNSTPVVNAPASVTAEATGADGAHVTYGAATASDAVDSTLPASCSPVSGSVFPLGDTLVTCSATDPHNSNIGTASLTVTVQDTTAPTLNVPASLSVEATGPSGADISFAPGTANDVVDGVITPICDAGPGTFAVGQTTVSCTATDTHSNTVTKTFTVSVTDTTPPVVTVPADMVVEATGPTGTPATFNASGADLVDGNVTAVCTPDSGKVFGLGETLVNCTADDSHGNVGKASFSVTVVDTTAPSLALSANLNADATSKSGTAVTFTATATDIVDGDVTPTCSPASGSTFAIGSTTVNCSATDAHTNAAAGHFTVVVSDTTPPVVSVPAAITAEATGPTGATVGWSPPTATDMVDGTDPVSCDRTSGSTFALGSTLVTCTSTNSNGLSAHNTFTVAVVDTTAPTLSLPANIMATATKAAGADVSYGKVSANDLVDGALTPSCSKASGSTFAAGVTTVTCAVTDSHHNTATASFTVTVTFAWSGLLNPVTDGGTYKLGSTIPVKFALTGASAGISTLAAQLYVTKVSGTPAGTSQPAISTSAASTGNMFRNDGTGYIFNLSTKPLSTGTWQLRVDLGDGVPHVVTISLR